MDAYRKSGCLRAVRTEKVGPFRVGKKKKKKKKTHTSQWVVGVVVVVVVVVVGGGGGGRVAHAHTALIWECPFGV